MLSKIQVQVQHSFYQNFSPPLATHALRPYLTTFLLSNFPPPLGNPCFQWLKFEYNIPFINFSPPPWQPMLCDPTWQHSVHQISPPLATHAFNDSSSSTTFLLTKFFPPLATHALRPYLTTFLLSNFYPPWQPMLSMIQVRVQHSFYQIFPPLGNPCFQWFKFKYNIPFNKISPPWQPTLCDPTWQHFLSNFPPPWQHMLSMIQVRVQHSFYQIFPPPPFGNPCFAPTWQHSPPPWQPMLPMIQIQVQHSFYENSPPPPWQPMLCDPTCQNSFYQISPPPPLATHALRPYLTTFPPLGNPCFQWFKFKYNIPFIKKFPPPPWQPMLCDPTWQHSFYQIFPPLGNPCFQWFKFKYNIPFIKIFPPPWQPMLCDPTWQNSFFQIFPPWQPMLSMIQVRVQHSFYQIFPPPLGNTCFQWFKFKYNIPFINFPPPLGNPCFATLPDKIPFFKFSPLGNPCFQWFKFEYNIPFIKFFPPLGNTCFQWFKFKYNIPFINFSPLLATHALRPYLTTFPPPWQPMLPMIQIQVQHSFYQNFSPPLETHAVRPYLTTFLLSNFPPVKEQPASQHHAKKTDILFCDPTQLLFPINSSEHR